MPYSRVIVPLDGSALAERALPLALALCAKTGASPVLLTVLPSPLRAWHQEALVAAGSARAREPQSETSASSTAGRSRGADARAGAAAYLEGLRMLPGALVVNASTEATEGDPASEIIRSARNVKADVIVMATRGRSGVVRGLLGSVTDRVTLGSPVPVLIVRSENAPLSIEAAGSIETVVTPLDGSELAETALRHAKTVAEGFGARLVLLRVLPPPGLSQPSEASEYLERVAARLGGLACAVITRAASGDPRGEIVALAEQEPHSMVVMTTRGASGFSRWVRGSVADGVVRTAAVPTMVVPPVEALLGPSIH